MLYNVSAIEVQTEINSYQLILPGVCFVCIVLFYVDFNHISKPDLSLWVC